MITIEEKSLLIKYLASEAGFNACGITKASVPEKDSGQLKTWLDNDYHAGLNYMLKNYEKRIDPQKVIKPGKSVIVVILNYFSDKYPFNNKKLKISRYAVGNDYHIVIKKKLQLLLEKIQQNIGSFQTYTFIDPEPVLNKAYAREAGLGWIGKNSLLINKKLGSFLFIGGLITDLELAYDAPVQNHCGNCRLCIDACPTGAITSHNVIDVNKCIAYYTIEHKGEIPEEIQSKMNGWFFGCDICQEICPCNKEVPPTSTFEFTPAKELCNMTENDWKVLTEEQFRNLFVNSAVKRTTFKRLKRNIEANL